LRNLQDWRWTRLSDKNAIEAHGKTVVLGRHESGWRGRSGPSSLSESNRDLMREARSRGGREHLIAGFRAFGISLYREFNGFAFADADLHVDWPHTRALGRSPSQAP
jgi:hypothetical protein